MAGGDQGIVLDEYEPNPQWDLLESSWEVFYGTTDVTISFTMTMKRVPSYVMFTVLVPVLLLTLLNIFVFILPCESGERVGYAVTVFLSFAVFFTLISAVLPASVSLFTIYVIVMTAQSAVICLIAIVQVRLSVKDEYEHPVPRWLVVISNLGRCRCGARCPKRVSVPNKTPVMTLKEMESTVNGEDHIPDTGDAGDGEKVDTWNHAISGLDMVFVVFFSLLSITVTAVCIGISATAD